VLQTGPVASLAIAPLVLIHVLTRIMMQVSIDGVIQTKRITANLPEDLLEDAIQVTGKGITDTLIEGLRMVRRARAYEKALALRGKIDLKIDLEESRERRRR
jgi:hypothetical protein